MLDLTDPGGFRGCSYPARASAATTVAVILSNSGAAAVMAESRSCQSAARSEVSASAKEGQRLRVYQGRSDHTGLSAQAWVNQSQTAE